MGLLLRALAVLLLIAGVVACGEEDLVTDAEGASAEEPPATEATEAEEEPAADAAPAGSLGDELHTWEEIPDAREILPIPDTLRISRQGTYGPDEPFFAARDEETPIDEVLADVERLLDELGWTDVEMAEDGGWTNIRAEHDDWEADFAVTSIRDGEGTMLEGGFSRRG